MRVTVFCEGIDVWVSNIPYHGIELTFTKYAEGGGDEIHHAVLSYEKAAELEKAIKFVAKNSGSVEVPF